MNVSLVQHHVKVNYCQICHTNRTNGTIFNIVSIQLFECCGLLLLRQQCPDSQHLVIS